jgi:hypothetical protein
VRRPAPSWLAIALAGLLACGPAGEGAPVAEAGDELALESSTESQLEALGYLAGTEPRGPQRGVTVHEPGRAQPGLAFYTSGHLPGAVLMDLEGRVLHTWRADFEELFGEHPEAAQAGAPERRFWRHAQLLPDGSVIGIWERVGVFELDRDSNVRWARLNRAHHDLFVGEEGEILVLVSETNELPGIGVPRAVEDFVAVLDPQGRELERRSIARALANARWRQLRRRFWQRERERRHGLPEAARMDPFHTNAIWRLSADEAARLGAPFAGGQLLVSMAMLDTIAAIDLEAGRTVWWQTGPFGLQHQPRVTRDGGIVVFNNHLAARRSSVQILDPRTGKVVWEYRGPNARPLYSRTSAGVEELANGNLLIVESNQGRALELTREKEVVWEFYNPEAAGNDEALVATIFHMDRVERPAWLED